MRYNNQKCKLGNFYGNLQCMFVVENSHILTCKSQVRIISSITQKSKSSLQTNYINLIFRIKKNLQNRKQTTKTLLPLGNKIGKRQQQQTVFVAIRQNKFQVSSFQVYD